MIKGFTVTLATQWTCKILGPDLTIPTCMRAEFHGERIVEMHMQRLGGKEQLLAQVYSAFATRRDDTVELALRAYGAPARRTAKTRLQACQCVQKELFRQR